MSAPLPPGPSVDAMTQGLLFHRDPVGMLSRCQARFGDVFTLSLPTARRLVVVADPDAVEVVAGADPAVATTGAGRRRLLGPASPRSVLGADGELHHLARRTVGPAFTPQALLPHEDAMAQLAADHVARWPRRRPFRLLPRVKTLADELFVRFVLGIRDADRVAGLTAAIRYMLLSPGTPPVPITTGDRGLAGVLGERLYRRRRAPVDRLLHEELRARRAAGVPDDALDVLSCLLRATDPPRTDAEIVDEVVPLLMAGQEPGAIGLTWVLDRAAREPGGAERLTGRWDARSDAFVDEALRLRPPVHSIVRPLVAPLEVAGHRFEPGVVLDTPIPLLHRDPRVFDAPHEFRPERFGDDLARPAAFVPFGGGARRCLGEALARAEFRTVLPAVLGRVQLTPLSRRPDRQVVRATVLPPHRSAPVVASDR